MALTGFIIGENNMPLPGASVQLTSKVGLQYLPTGIGTTTAQDGSYLIASPLATPDKWLTISYVGYITASVPVDYIIRQNAAGEDVATFLDLADPVTMQPVIIPGTTKKTGLFDAGNWGLFAGLGLLALLLLGKKKKR